ncbi:DUF3124 domain-containing protein [Tautonia sociabilis]|nr:DUF3124 domain-containing protein [Tautonia sociabilis]
MPRQPRIRCSMPLPALLLALALLPSCGGPGEGPGLPSSRFHEGLLLPEAARHLPPDSPVQAVLSRTVYVPVYSHVYLDDPREVYPLAVTLSVRNTDPATPIVIASIRYFDTSGTLVRNDLSQPVRLGPLATAEVVVRERDLSGGSGANFLVDWLAESPVSRPVIQAVMIGAAGNQGISFVCPGVDVSSLPPDS